MVQDSSETHNIFVIKFCEHAVFQHTNLEGIKKMRWPFIADIRGSATIMKVEYICIEQI